MSNRDEKLVDLTLHLHHKTEKAILVSDGGDKDDAIWVPLSQCEVEYKKGNVVIVTMPEWLAVEKGLY